MIPDRFKLYRIRSKLLAVFVTVAVIFGSGGMLSIVFFNDIINTTQGFVDDTLPKINAAKQLDITARNIDVNIHHLMTSRDREELNRYFATTSDRLKKLERLTASLSREDGNINILSLNRTSQAIRSQAQLLYQISNQRLLLQARIKTLSRQVRLGLQALAIRHFPAQAPASAEALHRTVLALLESIELGLLADTQAGVEAQHQQYQQLTAQLDKTFTELQGYAELFTLHSQRIRLDSAITLFLNSLNQEIIQLSADTADHSRRVFSHFKLQADNLLTRQRQMIGLTLALIMAASLALFMVYRQLVVKGFADRLTQISIAMKRVPSEYAHTPVPVAGKDEVAAMARALEGLLVKALRLRRLAAEDELTGVNNRRCFLERAALIAKQCKRDAKPACVLMLDIDRFKAVNDIYGHESGDRALQACAQTCLNTIRPLDLFARYGGEEFALLLPDTDLAAGILAGERIRKAVEGLSIPLAGKKHLRLTLSIGITEVDLSSLSIEEALNQADQALYRAKSGGRNRLLCWKPGAESRA